MADALKKELSKIKLGGQIYYIKDEAARQAISLGIDIKVVSVLPTPSDATMGKIYLILASKQDPEQKDVYAEYVTIKSEDEPPVYSWERFGTTEIQLVDYSKKTHTHTVTSNVSVDNHTFTPRASSNPSNVSFEGQQSKSALGKNATFKASKSNVNFEGRVSKKLARTTIRGVQDNEESFNHYEASAGYHNIGVKLDEDNETLDIEILVAQSKSFAKKNDQADTVATGLLDDENTGDGAEVVTDVGTATAEAQEISIQSDDEVNALTSVGIATAAAQEITVNPVSISHTVTNANVTTSASIEQEE